MRIQLREEKRIFQGTATQVVSQMQATAIFASHLTPDEYVDWCIENGRRIGLDVKVTGETLDERCASLIEQLVACDFASKL